MACIAVASGASCQDRPGEALGQASAWADEGWSSLGEPEVLLVFDTLGAQLQVEGGRRTVALVHAAGVVDAGSDLRAAWDRLVAALSLEPRLAFDRLLGDRVVIAVGRASLPVTGGWALATRVDRADVSRVLTGLGAVQRDVISGNAIFAVDRGAYRLCVIRGAEGARTVVLGPGGDSFDRAVRGLSSRRGSSWFAGAWPVGRGAAAGGAMLRVGRERAASLTSVSADETGWSGVVIGQEAVPQGAPGWTSEGAAALVDGASLGMVGSVSAGSLGDAAIAPLLGIDVGSIEAVIGSVPRRGALRIDAEASGALMLQVGLETAGGPAADVDEMLRKLAGVITAGSGSVPDFGGRWPGAVRTVSLRGGFAEAFGGRVLGVEPSLAWAVVGGAVVDGAEPAQRGAGASLGVSLAPPGLAAEGARTAAEGLVGVATGPVVSAGRLEPGPIAAALERAAGLDRPVLTWAGGITDVVWEIRRLDAERVSADVRVRLLPAD
ncbi:MAG: hypothetical protein AAFR96_03400 [Planctomycetota bacterium]